MSEMKRTKLYIFCILLIVIQQSTATPRQTVHKIFALHGVVPDVIPAAPDEFLKVTYCNGRSASEGVQLTPTQVKAQPAVEWKADDDQYYTLIMSDPDAPSRAEPSFREFNHWLVGNIPGNDIAGGDVISAYVGSGPPKGTGLHRYVFLLYKQPCLLRFDEHRVGNNSRENRPKFRAAKFARKYNLHLVAGNFFQAKWDAYVTTVHQQLAGM